MKKIIRNIQTTDSDLRQWRRVDSEAVYALGVDEQDFYGWFVQAADGRLAAVNHENEQAPFSLLHEFGGTYWDDMVVPQLPDYQDCDSPVVVKPANTGDDEAFVE